MPAAERQIERLPSAPMTRRALTVAPLSNTTATIEPSVDMFGLGVLLFYLLAGNEAYAKARQSTVLPDIREFAPMVTAPTARLVAELTHPDPAKRPVAASTCEELARIGRRMGIA